MSGFGFDCFDSCRVSANNDRNIIFIKDFERVAKGRRACVATVTVLRCGATNRHLLLQSAQRYQKTLIYESYQEPTANLLGA